MLRKPTLTLLLALLLLAAGPEPVAARDGAGASPWWANVEKVEESLRKGDWKRSRKRAEAEAREIARTSWTDPELKKVLAALSACRAIAAANLGQRDEALWYWFLAQNIDFRIWSKDLAPYGDAEKLLREFRLRARGEVPAGFVVPASSPYMSVEPPNNDGWPDLTHIENTGAVHERRVSDLLIELVIDEAGRIHHPVVLTPDTHPVTVYAVLDQLRGYPPIRPAVYDGEPGDSVYTLTVWFKILRW